MVIYKLHSPAGRGNDPDPLSCRIFFHSSIFTEDKFAQFEIQKFLQAVLRKIVADGVYRFGGCKKYFFL